MIVEYGQDGIVLTYCDVYSFSIMMIEALTGMRPSDEIFTGGLSLRYFGLMILFLVELWMPIC